MRIATWNLERVSAAEPRAGRLRQVMRAVQADVWVLTETDEHLNPGGNSMRSVTSGVPERRHRPGERWVTIWGPEGTIEPVPTLEPVRTACARVSREAGAPLLVYGTVLPWRADIRFTPLRGADAFCHALAEQAADWTRLRQTYPDHILCVAGDFNQEMDRPCRVGTTRGLRALSQALRRNNLVCLSGGADDPLGRRTGGTRSTIDHICLTAEARPFVSAPECWPDSLDGLTDHFGTSVSLLARR